MGLSAAEIGDEVARALRQSPPQVRVFMDGQEITDRAQVVVDEALGRVVHLKRMGPRPGVR